MYTKSFFITTSKEEEGIDITNQVIEIVKNSGIRNGLCNIYLRHATASIIINEGFDPNIMKDILKELNNIIPRTGWLHDRIDNNAHAHIKSSIMGSSITIPIINNELMLGRWQGILLLEFDGPRKREVIVSII